MNNKTDFSRSGSPWLFFVLACGLSWMIWLPTMYWLPEAAQTPVTLVGGFGPFFAAMILIAAQEGRSSLKAWLRTTFNPKIHWFWYLLGALILPLIMALIHHGSYLLLGGRSGFVWTTEMLGYPIAVVLTALLGGGNEEPGWRAYATPVLIQRHHPLVASTLVGFVWVIWHLPLFSTDQWSGRQQPLFWFFLYAIALSIIMTWLYFRSKRAVIPVMLLHGATNAIFKYFPRENTVFSEGNDFDMFKNIAYWTVAIVIIIATRGRLGVVRENSHGRL